MTYRAATITQRDGSALANSNCRMASIAAGLDYHTLGRATSTGAKMRSYTDDQSGGTDSGDARQSWDRGYAEVLTIRDGATFDAALEDLRSGRMVHLDIWAATAGGPCLSGTGNYGHTIAVAPESHHSESEWLVSDPWCSPPKWVYWPSSKLRAGAEQWGGQVYAAASAQADWPTGGTFPTPDVPRTEIRWRIIARIVRELMTQYRPDRPALFPPMARDTGGGGRCLFTVTRDNREEAEAVGVALKTLAPWSGTVELTVDGGSAVIVATGELVALERGTRKRAFMTAQLGAKFLGWPAGTPVIVIGDQEAFFIREQVREEPDGPAPGGGTYDEGWNDARAAVSDALDTWVTEVLPPA